jgi:flagellar FliJ protein
MKKFRFRLETLLKYRKMEEEQAQIKIAEGNTRLYKEQELLNNFQNDLRSNLDSLSKEQAGSPTIETLKTFSYYIDKIKRDIAIQREQVAKAEVYRQECLEVLEKAIRGQKLVDNLRKKRLEQYNAELLQEEQKILALYHEHTNVFEGDFAVRLERCVERLSQIEISESIESSRLSISEALHEGILRDLRTVLGDALASRERVILLIDNLDKGWEKGNDLPCGYVRAAVGCSRGRDRQNAVAPLLRPQPRP